MSDLNPENIVLKKRLNTFKTSKGSLIGVPDEVIIDVLKAWEKWSGSYKLFCQSIGIKREQLAFIIKKGKRLFKEGRDKIGPFTPIQLQSPSVSCNAPIILHWNKKNTIRFYQVGQLIEFLKKAA